MDIETAKTLGRAAHQAGEPRSPFLHPEIAAAVAGLPVGGGAAEIFAAYTAGWDEANFAAPVLSTIVAAYEVYGGTATELELDTTGMSPDEIAQYLQENNGSGISLCHQCAHEISDPQVGELTGFTVDGQDYELDPESGWTAAKKP